MGLNKFPGDTREAKAEELDAWIKSIENVNRSTSTVLFCITPWSQLQLMEKILKANGYPDVENLFLHKQWKSDKAVAGGLVSSLLFAVVGYKSKAASWGSASLPADSVQRLGWRQNLWTLTKPTPAQVDTSGNKVNRCPQDPSVVERLITMFRPKCIFSHGEGAGWGAPVALAMGVDYICTEPDTYTYSFLINRLQSLSGELVFSEGQKQQFFRRVHAYIAKKEKADDSKVEKREAILKVLQETQVFQGVSDKVAGHVVESLAEIGDLDLKETAEVVEAARKSVRDKEGDEEDVVDLSALSEDDTGARVESVRQGLQT